jgi:uncharacterized zinc-type alcohol dehydrogenase-like protein
MKISSYAAMAAKQKLEPFEFDAKHLDLWGVEIKVECCGICHSDIHLIDDDWGISEYPLVPGHEIIGQVVQAGPNVKKLKIGDRVGVGWQAGSCMECEWCLRGEENLCPRSEPTCVRNYGGFAETVWVDSRFVFLIPAALESESTAPLLCGGVTVYSPLRHYDIRPYMKVGVVGVGGLGHLALQFARAFGCEVTAISSTADKEREAHDCGAHHFVVSNQPKQLEKAAGSLDFILSTVNADLDWAVYLKVLKPKGRLCVVGVPPLDMKIPAFGLIAGEKSVSGSVIGSRSTIEEMLQLAARCVIRAKTEPMPFSEVNPAVDRVRRSDARYRVVLKR